VFELPAAFVATPVVDNTTTVIDGDPLVPTTPTLGLTAGASISYLAGSAAGALDPSLSISGSDSPALTGATVTIGVGFLAGDVLAVGSAQTGIPSSYNAGTGC
jgi:trimeric autotransporter adhesin